MRTRHLPATPRAHGLVLAGVLSAVACAETTASAPAPTAASAPRPTAGAEMPWAEMNKQQRIDYMKAVVLPRMRQVFASFNPDRYGKMNCMTCHGDSAADGTFRMPNPRLPVLPATSDGFKKLAMEKPAIMEFMKNEVKPKMAALLGEPEYNPETKSGFGCMECHTMPMAQ